MAVVPESVVTRGNDPDRTTLTSSQPGESSVVVTPDVHGPNADTGTFYVELPQFAEGAYFELSMDTDVTEVFWIVVGYLREGSVHSGGHDWIHVEEAGLWRRASASTRMLGVEPEWATRLPD